MVYLTQMEIYIEYALLENFFMDGTLLFLALKLSKSAFRVWKILFSALLGAVFAVVFPLLPLPSPLAFLGKFSFPFLLCFLTLERKKGRGRYALTVLLFYALSFSFAGLLIGVFGALDIAYFFDAQGGIVTNIPVGALFAALTFFAFSCCAVAKKLYAVKRVHAHISLCVVKGEKGSVKVLGYEDTGNAARYRGLPVCFVTPDVFYDACGEGVERTTIQTLAGEKRVTVKRAVVTVAGVERETYASPSAGLIGREYKVLLPKGE